MTQLTDKELGRIAYQGFDAYWTEECPGREAEAWTASAKAVLAAVAQQAAPAASQEAAPHQGTMDDVRAAMDLLDKVRTVATNGEALAAVLAYRRDVRAAQQAAQPPQAVEPVAWLGKRTYDTLVFLKQPTQQDCETAGVNDCVPLYTFAPTAQPLARLTDEQIDEEWFDVHTLPVNNVAKARLFARALERALADANGKTLGEV